MSYSGDGAAQSTPQATPSFGMFGQGPMGNLPWNYRLALALSSASDAVNRMRGEPSDNFGRTMGFVQQAAERNALANAKFDPQNPMAYVQSLAPYIGVDEAIKAASGMRGLQGVRTLTADEAKAKGYRAGTVVQEGPSGEDTIAQQSDVKSPEAVAQEFDILKNQPQTPEQRAELAAQYAQMNKPVAVQPGETLMAPMTGKVVGTVPLFPGMNTNAPGGSKQANLHGTDFLATLPSSFATVVKGMGDYKLAPTSPYMMGRNPAMAMALNGAVQQYNPEYDATQFPVKQKAREAFASGQDGRTTQSISVAISHLDLLKNAFAALHNNDIPLFNTINNAWLKQTGSPLPTNVDAIAGIAADEVTNAAVGGGRGGGALTDRQETKATISKAMSKGQFGGAIDQYKGLMAGKLQGLKRRYEVSTKLTDFNDYLSPEARQTLESLPSFAGTGGQQQHSKPNDPLGIR